MILPGLYPGLFRESPSQRARTTRARLPTRLGVTGKRRHAALEEAPVSIEEAASTAVEETKILEAPAPEVTAVVPSEEQAVVVEGATDGAEVTEGAIVEAAEGEIVEGEEVRALVCLTVGTLR